MKKILFLLLIIVAVGCTQPLYVYWDYPPDGIPASDSVYFETYVWQGMDTTLFDTLAMDTLAAIIYYIPGQQTYKSERYIFHPNTPLRAAIRAFDALGRQSDLGLTRFYMNPKEVREVWVGK